MTAQSAVTDLTAIPAVRTASNETIWLHWLTLAAVALLIGVGFGHDLIENREARRFVMDIHRSLGIVVGLAVFARLYFVFRDRDAEGAALISPLAKIVAKATHGLLYLLLIALPVVGLMQSSAARPHPTLFGAIPLPRLVAYDTDLGDTLGEWHEKLAWALIALVVFHAAAALYRHHIRKDDTLTAMAPWLRGR